MWIRMVDFSKLKPIHPFSLLFSQSSHFFFFQLFEKKSSKIQDILKFHIHYNSLFVSDLGHMTVHLLPRRLPEPQLWPPDVAWDEVRPATVVPALPSFNILPTPGITRSPRGSNMILNHIGARANSATGRPASSLWTRYHQV